MFKGLMKSLDWLRHKVKNLIINNSTHMCNCYALCRFRSKWAEAGKRHYKFQNLNTLMSEFCGSNNESSQMHIATILILFSRYRKEDKAPMRQKYFQFCLATMFQSLFRGIIKMKTKWFFKWGMIKVIPPHLLCWHDYEGAHNPPQSCQRSTVPPHSGSSSPKNFVLKICIIRVASQ